MIDRRNGYRRDARNTIKTGFAKSHEVKREKLGSESMRTFEKAVMLRALDHHWKEHLALMDQLRQSVNLRGYGQKNPVQEYKRESFEMFTDLLETINIEIVKALCSVSFEQVNRQQKEIIEEREQVERIDPVQRKAKLPQEEPQLGSLKKILKLEETTLAHAGLVKNINSAMARTESFFPQGFL